MASETRRGKAHTAACARKIRSRATGNSCWRSPSLESNSASVMPAQYRPRPGRDSGKSHVELPGDVVEVTHVESDDLVGDGQQDGQVNEPRHPLREGAQFAGAFLLIVLM